MSDFPTTFISEIIYTGIKLVDSVSITMNYTGNIKFEITLNATDANPTWKEVSLVSSTTSIATIDVPGRFLQYRIIGVPDSIMQLLDIGIMGSEDTILTSAGNILITTNNTIAYNKSISIYNEV